LTGTPDQPLYQHTNEGPSDGRHHLGMMGAIISEWVGGIVGIRIGGEPTGKNAPKRKLAPSVKGMGSLISVRSHIPPA
jgi:hypothetical protein